MLARYDAAIEDLSKAISINPTDYYSYFQRATVYTVQERFNLGVADANEIIRTSPFVGYRWRGYIYLAEMQYDSASADFSRAINLDHKDPYAVLALHVARMRVGVEDSAEFRNNLASLNQVTWPAPVVAFYEGAKASDELVAEATDNGRRCEAHFYIAEFQLARNFIADARKSLEEALEVCPADYSETILGQIELRRLEPNS